MVWIQELRAQTQEAGLKWEWYTGYIGDSSLGVSYFTCWALLHTGCLPPRSENLNYSNKGLKSGDLYSELGALQIMGEINGNSLDTMGLEEDDKLHQSPCSDCFVSAEEHPAWVLHASSPQYSRWDLNLTAPAHSMCL